IDLIKADILEHTATFLDPADILVCASAPSPIKVKQSATKQWLEPIPPEVKAVKQRLEFILGTEWETLQVQNLHHQVKQIRTHAQQTLYQDYRRDGEKVIQKYQWLTGAAIFANPLTGLDLLANAAINTQMLLELSQIYDRKFTPTEAREMATILSQSMLKLGLVELITTTIGNMIKFNTLTFAIGGSLQGFTAAYLTRVGGISFMKYIEQELDPVPDQPQSLEILCAETYKTMESQPLIKAFLQEASLQIAAAKG
ncbi:MAG: YcjF family protein, partial [Candidatus Competibacteraceae bacterium]|nr:YcjF family protein [Candidatus Competibacteraceae bacterium]